MFRFPSYSEDFRSTLKLAWPMIISQISFVLMGAVDNIMIAKLGVVQLATTAFCNNIFAVVIVTQMGLASSISPLIANSIGSKDFNRVGKQFRHGLVLLLGLSSILVFVLIWLGYNFDYFGQSKEVQDQAWDYFKWLIASLPLVAIFQAYKQFFDGIEQSKKPMQYLYIGILLNLFFNWVLIYGNLGFPAMGISGAGLGTFLTRVALIFLLIYEAHFRGPWEEIYKLSFKNFRLEKVIWKRMISLGIPSSFQYLCEVAAFSMAGIFAGQIGNLELASHQIAINLASLTFMGALGWSFATSIKIGNALGQGSIEKCRQLGINSLLSVTLYMIITAILFIIFRNQLPKIYLDDQEIIAMVSQVLIIAAFFQLGDGLQAVGIGMLRGLQDVRVPTLITLVSYWGIAIPLARYLAFHSSFGLVGIWLALAAGLYLSAGLLIWRFLNRTKNRYEPEPEHV